MLSLETGRRPVELQHKQQHAGGDHTADVDRATVVSTLGAIAYRPNPIRGADSLSDEPRWRVRVKKSDTQLQQDILAELKWEPSINAAEIGVEVKDGIVTLAGHVNTYAEKWDAERATQRVAGVKALAVEMDVKIEGMNNRTDADIARSAENVLQWTTYLTKDAVKIKVEKGWVTLTGEVEWQYQRQAATAAIRYLMGVTGVSDQITIKTKVSAPVIKSDIEAALKRRARQDAQDISVSVHGADVTLTGKVHSWSERELAHTSAWGTPGVRSVVDNTTMSY
jgi:osmotically-inducible protein OsmY